MNGAHQLAVGPRTVRRPAPALWREEVFPAEFRAVIWTRVRHRERPEISVRDPVLLINQTGEVELGGLLVVRVIGCYSGRSDETQCDTKNCQGFHVSCCALSRLRCIVHLLRAVALALRVADA